MIWPEDIGAIEGELSWEIAEVTAGLRRLPRHRAYTFLHAPKSELKVGHRSWGKSI